MDARLLRIGLILSAICSMGANAVGETFRTANFVVHAPTAAIAKQVALTAERSREDLAKEWLGEKLPKNWYRPCNVKVRVGQIGAGGATTFTFDRGEVSGWNMQVQGSLERILDSVIPHEVSHTIFACHFRRPLPRWADEGAATLAEHESEQHRQRLMLGQVLRSNRRIPLRRLFAMKEYPADMQNVLTLYAEGYSVTDYLVQQGGKIRYLKFLGDAHRRGWDAALKTHYGLGRIETLEKKWNSWVTAGSPSLKLPQGQQLASADTPVNGQPVLPEVVVRSQSPNEPARPPQPQPSTREKASKVSDQRPRRRNTIVSSGTPAKRVRMAASTSEVRTASPLDGRIRALEAGWIPVAPAHRTRPAMASVSANRSRPEPETQVRHDTTIATNWSEFPRRREDGGSTRLGRTSNVPLSP